MFIIKGYEEFKKTYADSEVAEVQEVSIFDRFFEE